MTRAHGQSGFASVYMLAGIGVLLVLLTLSGKWIIALKEDAAIAEVEKQALAESVNAAAAFADGQERIARMKSEELLANQREKQAIRAKLSSVQRGLAQLETTDDEVKSWIARCDLPHALFVCLQNGDCGEGIAGPNP